MPTDGVISGRCDRPLALMRIPQIFEASQSFKYVGWLAGRPAHLTLEENMGRKDTNGDKLPSLFENVTLGSFKYS